MSARYLLDTNILSDLVRNPQGAIARRIAKEGEDSVCTSIIVASELRYGAAKLGSAGLTQKLDAILDAIEILPMKPPADSCYGQIRSALEKAGKIIGPNDLLIAAHAIAAGCTVVTANSREFARVPGLSVEDWLE
jgi:tRNA(fMet)-specific endonuclease VapC